MERYKKIGIAAIAVTLGLGGLAVKSLNDPNPVRERVPLIERLLDDSRVVEGEVIPLTGWQNGVIDYGNLPEPHNVFDLGFFVVGGVVMDGIPQSGPFGPLSYQVRVYDESGNLIRYEAGFNYGCSFREGEDCAACHQDGVE